MSAAISRDLTADEILAWCAKNSAPANARADAAIAAHRIAFARYQKDRAAEDLAMIALRVIVLASSPSAADDQAKLDYLSALPDTAWESCSVYTSIKMREETLAAIRRHLAAPR